MQNLTSINHEVVPIVPINSRRNCNTRQQISPSKHWCFTYNSYTEVTLSLFSSIVPKYSSCYVYQEEIGESGNKHIQGYIRFHKKLRPKSVFSDFPTIHWEKTRNWKGSIRYCSDHSKRAAGGGIWHQGVVLPACIKTISRDSFREWQEEITKELSGDPDDRSIRWLWEPRGNVGKTSLAKWLHVNMNALVLSGKGNDMKYGLIRFYEKFGAAPNIIIIDIPRTVKDYVSYSGIEDIKNGIFFCGKYEGQMLCYNSPHVLCLSNTPPDTEKMSLDRWKISQIIDNKLFNKP